MKVDDSSNYVTATYTDDDSVTHTNQQVWKYGGEHWCNLQGRYTSIVADLSGLTGPYEMSLCNVAILGTKYKITDEINQVTATNSVAKAIKLRYVSNISPYTGNSLFKR